mmetsp:Transcript_25687/g.45572  ORF Transcript_25687/g.45572 Transcript_25687/m.45572 type:complete len:203 (-) Transcript_25687:137-745(-)
MQTSPWARIPRTPRRSSDAARRQFAKAITRMLCWTCSGLQNSCRRTGPFDQKSSPCSGACVSTSRLSATCSRKSSRRRARFPVRTRLPRPSTDVALSRCSLTLSRAFIFNVSTSSLQSKLALACSQTVRAVQPSLAVRSYSCLRIPYCRHLVSACFRCHSLLYGMVFVISHPRGDSLCCLFAISSFRVTFCDDSTVLQLAYL